ncbi:hypothetical protein KIW84_012993 [Lathyrus oleraceus]|uniref:DUF7745 domain-containing protein n=1 Tax=Pisum sativum TaxID=3888 RepID=A0A9D5BJA5_PEA|nr:hypothetical protein KIW84_012993 [Pisum sativum]
MDSNKRKTLRIKAQMPYVQSLKVFQDLIPNSIQRKFTLKYGRILYLLGVHVKVEAIISVTQFYDPPIGFLLFKKIQLAPMLEEFGLLKDDELEEFILHGGDTKHKEFLRRITRELEKVHVRENKMNMKNTLTKESYTPWVKEKVQLVNLPFVIHPTYLLDIPAPILISIEEVDCLKATVAKLEQDK